MLDPKLQSLLQSLRQRVRRYVVWDSVLAILAVALVAFWVGLAVDYLPVLMGGTEMPRSARGFLLLVVTVAIVFIVAKLLIGRLSKSLPDDSLALLVERHHPQLGGRLVTAVQLDRPGRQHDAHSKDLLRMVHDEAAQVIDQVDPNRVFRWQPLARKAMVAGPLLLCCIGLAIFSPQSFARAASRLTLFSDDPWPRRARLEMVGVELPLVSASEQAAEESVSREFVDNVVRLPVGSNPMLRIRADAENAEVPDVCTVYYQTDDGTRGQSNMRRVGRVRDGYQGFVLDGPPLTGLSESMTFTVQGLDDRLADYRIEAVAPPAISKMQVNVRYPEYLRTVGGEGPDLQTEYQAGLRISEGSEVTLQASSSAPLGDVDIVYEIDGQETRVNELTWNDEQSQFAITLPDFKRPTAVRMVPRDPTGISSQAPYRYFLGAVLDQPPNVTLKLDGITSAITPSARLPLSSTATDDYGVQSLTFNVVSAAGDDGEVKPAEANAPTESSVSPELDRAGNASAVIDLRDLTADGKLIALQPGSALNVFAEATDGYDLDGTHTAASELFRLQVVTPEALLALLERRELGLRSRLEQTITEMMGLRETLTGFPNGELSDDPDQEAERLRELQIRRLRVQQVQLQAQKTSEELTGIATSLEDILAEMVNNRVDSADRRERLGEGVRDPLKQIVEKPLAKLIDQIAQVERSVETPKIAAEKTEQAVQTADEVLLALNAVLDKMLDLESYNEILDMVRGLINDQEALQEETKEERKKRVRDLFK
ncbi:polyketide synthase [Stieleria varia]|uniref:Polyketide synthase n=1 Tax=Stieleria varia TaxID=2528005 RepID=A0A5C6AU22_9BACT|nr:polyketide synthase [Stieleria varia]TWU02977.1 hypothetical protein Pla52n_40660 [Stieleria varia]